MLQENKIKLNDGQVSRDEPVTATARAIHPPRQYSKMSLPADYQLSFALPLTAFPLGISGNLKSGNLCGFVLIDKEMTVGSHVAEIVRQGIWASLTGGWYYEPSYTLFCNAVHLYLWLILFLIPLLFGLSFNSISSVYVTVAYVTFIVLLFIILKFTVSYLHNLFDTVDPTPYPPLRSFKIESFSCETVQHSNEKLRDEEIEMVDLRKKDDGEVKSIGYNLSRDSSGRRRCVRIGNNSISSVDEEIRMCKKGDGEWKEDRQSGEELLSPTTTTLLPVDSFDLLQTGTRHQSDGGTNQCIRIDRKFSEPCLKEAHIWNGRRRLSDTDSCVRRAKSVSETSNKESTISVSMLSQQMLEECKRDDTSH
ncbi:Pecanex-like protein 1 [Dirofilaria immitis]|nr:Pecanex-like protein 1 [Dirofilaria immitis]